jgi:hypothetical protein
LKLALVDARAKFALEQHNASQSSWKAQLLRLLTHIYRMIVRIFYRKSGVYPDTRVMAAKEGNEEDSESEKDSVTDTPAAPDGSIIKPSEIIKLSGNVTTDTETTDIPAVSSNMTRRRSLIAPPQDILKILALDRSKSQRKADNSDNDSPKSENRRRVSSFGKKSFVHFGHRSRSRDNSNDYSSDESSTMTQSHNRSPPTCQPGLPLLPLYHPKDAEAPPPSQLPPPQPHNPQVQRAQPPPTVTADLTSR